MKTLGTIRRTDCVEAELVLASGVYLTFRLPADRTVINSLIEVQRSTKSMRPRESILVDAHTLQLARKAAFDAILRHRSSMHIRMMVKVWAGEKPFQLSFQI